MLVLVVNYSPLAILQCAKIPQISLPINLAAPAAAALEEDGDLMDA